MTAPRWPAPGTTFGPDRLDEVRALLRACPGRGVWIVDTNRGKESIRAWSLIGEPGPGETWHYVGPHPGDPPDTQPAEPEPARTVTLTSWCFACDNGDGVWRWWTRSTRELAEAAWHEQAHGYRRGPVVEVRAALPLPVEPAVVVGTVVTKEVSDGKA